MNSDDAIEILRPDLPRGRFRAVLFDFDGTLSLLREGWPAVMTELMLAELRGLGPAEQLAELVSGIVVGLNGRPTIVQMQALSAAVEHRGGRPAAPVEYAAIYQEHLFQMIPGRYDGIRSHR